MFNLIFGLALIVTSQTCLFLGIEPFYTYFYEFVWWGYIFFIDGINYKRKGSSLIISRTDEFLLMIPLSAAWWLFFELVNLRINNWHYINLPENIFLRWQGYFIAYATVLPALFETKEFVQSFFGEIKVKQKAITPGFKKTILAAGVLFLLLPLVAPKYFFPFVWGSLIFLLEPLLYDSRGKSILRDWENGGAGGFIMLLVAGFLCGGLWEFWNFWAKAKWIYTVPYVGGFKIFEMPALGFLGFPPFAVMSGVFWNFILLIKDRKRKLIYNYHTVIILAVYCIICFMLIDRFTGGIYGY